jgi:hypothetical protein
MTAAEVLANHGTQRAAAVVDLAEAAGLELAAAATLLEKESRGGHNVFGHDNVDTGGFYEKGGEVTEEAYRNYKAHRNELGAQGVGPTQLTLPAFQDRADELGERLGQGGCFDFLVNCQVGFEILADHIKERGIRDGFRAYNGSGPKAERYADDAVKKLDVWRSRLGGALGEEDMPLNDVDKKFLTDLRDDGVRMLDHGDPSKPGHDNAHSKILQEVSDLQKDIKLIKSHLGIP